MRFKHLRPIQICAALGAAAVVAAGAPSPVGAQTTPGTVTLDASRTAMSYGAATKLKGHVSTGEANEPIEIVDQHSNVVAATSTTEKGKYVLAFQPKKNMTIHANWEGVSSEEVVLEVRAVTHVSLTNVRLFDKAMIKGGAIPGSPSDKALVTIRRAGRVVAKKHVATAGGDFSLGFRIEKPGAYIAKVHYKPNRLRGSDSITRKIKTPLPNLDVDSHNSYVGALEKRLHQLNYYLTGIKDNYYDVRTADAVRAFNKVNGRARVGNVTAATWRALASPRTPHARTKKGYRIEVDQTKQVFYQVKSGKILNIVHVSTGANGATRDGNFKIYKKGGDGAEFYPSYFDGARAFHVWADVPPSAASHGCIRLPYWTRNWYWKKTPIGTKVAIYHS